jgi:hypothetical protein
VAVIKPPNAERHFKIRILRAHRTLTELIRPTAEISAGKLPIKYPICDAGHAAGAPCGARNGDTLR